MFWKSFYGLILSMVVLIPVNGQDVVIYSKKSDEVAKLIQELIDKIDDKTILKTFKVSSVTPETAESTEFTGKSFEVDDTLEEKAKDLSKAKLADFIPKATALEKKDIKAQMPLLTEDTIKAITEEFSKLKEESLAPLNDALKRLNAENTKNEELQASLTKAEAKDLSKVIDDLLKALKEMNEEAVIKSAGEPVVEIKKTAEEVTQRQAEEKYPFPNRKVKEAEAVKKFPKFKVGDKVSITFYPTPTRPQKASGMIRSMTKDKIKVNFSTVNIDDIKDPIMRDGMRSDVTDKNRKKFVDDIFTAIRKARTKYYNENLQPNADSIITENEKKGFILAGGKWQPSAEYATTLLESKLKDWKTGKLKLLEDAKLADGQLLKAIEAERSAYNKPTEVVLEKFKHDIVKEAEQVIAQKTMIDNKAVEFSEEELIKYNEEQAKKAEEDKKLADEKKVAEAKRKADIAKKKALAQEANKEPEDSGSSQSILIGVVLLVVGGIAFVFFNPKLRDKLIPSGKKKKSMEDVLSNLAPPPGNAPLPMPGGPEAPGSPAAAPPGIPAGMGAPVAGDTEKTKIDLDGDVSIVKRDGVEDAPQAAPRKKISLNLGSSAAPLTEESASQAGTTQNSIDPGSIGGLTPPGGGLTPPGGGLTPPGGGLKPPGGLTPPGGGLKPPGGLTPPGGASQAPGSDDSGADSGTEDKSNLILNPNLDGSGSKLRLKK